MACFGHKRDRDGEPKPGTVGRFLRFPLISDAFAATPLRPASSASSPVPPSANFGLLGLLDDVYMVAVQLLDADALRSLDAACRQLRVRNNSDTGSWHTLGMTHFRGLKVGTGGFFDAEPCVGIGPPQCKRARLDWKLRYGEFGRALFRFSAPFDGTQISNVHRDEAVADLSCRLSTDPTEASGIYLELEVSKNPDNLSLAVQDDIEEGAPRRGSLTFSPDTGAVIRERIVRDWPRKCEGAYIQPLPFIQGSSSFLGFIGLFLHRGQIAFFRRAIIQAAEGKEPVLGPWECTGFVSDFTAWAKGRWLTPCVAFRKSGDYAVTIKGTSRVPPIAREQWASRAIWIVSDWTPQDWEADG